MVRRKKPYRCAKDRCEYLPYLGGLCKTHYEEQEVERSLREAALKSIHEGVIDDSTLTIPNLKAELDRLRTYWWAARDVNIARRGTPTMPLEEAPYAQEWCIRLAEQIVIAERAEREGKKPGYPLEECQNWVWQRFENLDKGLHSNGIPRRDEPRKPTR